MSYLPSYYRAANAESGHDPNCSWGAGADCYCSVYERDLERKRYQYVAVRGHYLTLANALPGTTFHKDAKAFNAAVEATVNRNDNDNYIAGDPLYHGAMCVAVAKVLLAQIEAFIAAESGR